MYLKNLLNEELSTIPDKLVNKIKDKLDNLESMVILNPNWKDWKIVMKISISGSRVQANLRTKMILLLLDSYASKKMIRHELQHIDDIVRSDGKAGVSSKKKNIKYMLSREGHDMDTMEINAAVNLLANLLKKDPEAKKRWDNIKAMYSLWYFLKTKVYWYVKDTNYRKKMLKRLNREKLLPKNFKRNI